MEHDQRQPPLTTDRCPVCGTPTVPIVYGYPTGQTVEAAERGELVLGGCVVGPGQPRQQCTACRAAERPSDNP